jgi:hypothetical protein
MHENTTQHDNTKVFCDVVCEFVVCRSTCFHVSVLAFFDLSAHTHRVPDRQMFSVAIFHVMISRGSLVYHLLYALWCHVHQKNVTSVFVLICARTRMRNLHSKQEHHGTVCYASWIRTSVYTTSLMSIDDFHVYCTCVVVIHSHIQHVFVIYMYATARRPHKSLFFSSAYDSYFHQCMHITSTQIQQAMYASESHVSTTQNSDTPGAAERAEKHGIDVPGSDQVSCCKHALHSMC